MLEMHDAGLVIGDPALQIDRSRYLTYDLAEEWIRLTGKPFVFAFWAVRQAALKDAPRDLDLATVFQESRDHGLLPESLDCIAREWGPRLGLSQEDVKSYLTENIHYSLDPDCLDGLQLFYQPCSRMRGAAIRSAIVLSRCGEGSGDLVLVLCPTTSHCTLPLPHSNAAPYPRFARGLQLGATAPFRRAGGWFCWESRTTPSFR